MYIWSAFVFFVAGGIMALLVRLQLAQANADIATAERLQRASRPCTGR